MAIIGNRIDIAAAYLRAGDVVSIPTETVYGLAGNALDSSAVARIFEAKKRPHFDPLIIHLGSIQDIQRYAVLDNAKLMALAEKFMPGPITLLLPKKDVISDLVTSGSDRVAVRIPNHPLTRRLLMNLDFPLAAPSANPFGYISPTSAQHVQDQLGGEIPYILDGGGAQIGLESTIVGEEDGRIMVYRKGGLTIDVIREVVEELVVFEHSSSNPKAPGMLKSHYAPNSKIKLVQTWDAIPMLEGLRIGALTFGVSVENMPTENQRNLSTTGNSNEAAQNLFKYMRELDNLNLDIIYTKLLPEEGLGIAINDRLRRATV